MAACQVHHGHMAMANDVDTFKVLRGIYDEYLAADGKVAGVWLDGMWNETASKWRCVANDVDCATSMPWTLGTPVRQQTARCVLMWHSRGDGVANWSCGRKVASLCKIP